MTVIIHKKELDKLNKAVTGKTNIELYTGTGQIPIPTTGYQNQRFERPIPESITHRCMAPSGQELGTYLYGPIIWRQRDGKTEIEAHRPSDLNARDSSWVKFVIF